MKRIVLLLTVLAFAVAVQAGDGKCSKAQAACPQKDQTACAEKAKSGCPATKTGCCPKTQCPKAAAKKAVMSPKAAGEAAK
jgi:hypothetical protein